ncbi:MAG: hypothetical protein HYY64_20095, partial [Candidatus Rokubacteria bacterium]|nr:hypothetical protein [Candidatus Rokubacteria bacterium]
AADLQENPEVRRAYLGES